MVTTTGLPRLDEANDTPEKLGGDEVRSQADATADADNNSQGNSDVGQSISTRMNRNKDDDGDQGNSLTEQNPGSITSKLNTTNDNDELTTNTDNDKPGRLQDVSHMPDSDNRIASSNDSDPTNKNTSNTTNLNRVRDDDNNDNDDDLVIHHPTKPITDTGAATKQNSNLWSTSSNYSNINSSMMPQGIKDAASKAGIDVDDVLGKLAGSNTTKESESGGSAGRADVDVDKLK